MRFVYWSVSSFFFFAASVLAISILIPGPTETQVMRFMEGMMSAMHGSLMGASMDGAETYALLLQQSARMSVLMIILGIGVGVPLRMWRKSD